MPDWVFVTAMALIFGIGLVATAIEFVTGERLVPPPSALASPCM